MNFSQTLHSFFSATIVTLFLATLLSLTSIVQAKEHAALPVTTEFLDAASGEILDSRADRLPAYYGKADAAPSALTPTGTAWKARWQTQLVVQAKDDYHFELRGAGAGALQIDDKDVVGQLNETSAAMTLAAGGHPLVITFTPPKSGDAQLRLFWKSSSFGWEPVAATSLKQPASLAC